MALFFYLYRTLVIKYLEANPNLRIGNADITIPVVVNIVYKNSDENISDAIVQTQIDQLNADFNRLNDQSNIPASVLPIVGTPNIQFCLQQVKRATTTISKFVLGDVGAPSNFSVLETILPPTNKNIYLNIYISDIGSLGVNGYTREDLGGFTFIPSNINSSIFIDYVWFGKPGINGRSAGHVTTHEVGHWLGLCHPWTISSSCISGVSNMPTSHTDIYLNCDDNAGTIPTHMNFMEYKWEDECRTMFTSGQVFIMRAMLSSDNPITLNLNDPGPLYSITNPNNNIIDPNRCSFLPSATCPGANIRVQNTTVTILSPTSVKIIWDRTPNAIGYTIKYWLSGSPVTTITQTEPSIIINNLQPPPSGGSIIYYYTIYPIFVSCIGNSLNIGSLFTIKDLDMCSNYSFVLNEPNNIISSQLAYNNLIIPDNTTHNKTISDNLSSASDEDWFRVKTNVGQSSFQITLQPPLILEINYDLEIYDCSGNLIRSSNNNPSMRKQVAANYLNEYMNIYFRETITLNDIIPQTDYYIRIIDRGTTVHTSSCYTIIVSEQATPFINY